MDEREDYRAVRGYADGGIVSGSTGNGSTGGASGGDDTSAGSQLSGLAIGSLALEPDFSPEVTAYTVTTSNATNKVTATSDGDVEITLNGEVMENGTSAAWNPGYNELVITAGGTAYTVTVLCTKGYAEVSDADGITEAMADSSVSVVSLASDVETDILLEGGEKTLNLNGYSITSAGNDTENSTYAVKAANGASLTINADGSSVYGGSGSKDNVAVWADGEGTTVTINGGTYDVGADAENGVNDTIYAENGANIIINGGTFKNSGNGLVLNCQNDTDSSITCYGGTYYGQNPADGDDVMGGTFVADGHASTETESGVYTVE